MSLAHRIKSVRKSLGNTQKEMADAIGVSLRAWQSYEREKSVPGGKVLQALAERGVDVNWLLTGEGEIKIEPWHREAHEDMVKAVYVGDKDAARRQGERVKETGPLVRQSREAAEEMAGRITAGLGLDESKREYLLHELQTGFFKRMVAEQQRDKAWSKVVGGGDPDPGMGECVEMLLKIHTSGDQVLTRAINANLQAFSTAIDDRQRADQAIAKLGDLEARIAALERRPQGSETDGSRQQKAG